MTSRAASTVLRLPRDRKDGRDAGEIIVTHGAAGSFTGEMAVRSGRRGVARIRAREAGEVIEVNRSRLMALVQTDSAGRHKRRESIVHGAGWPRTDPMAVMGRQAVRGLKRPRVAAAHPRHSRDPRGLRLARHHAVTIRVVGRS